MSSSSWPVQVDHVYGCWLWQDRTSKDGYGLIWRGTRPRYAHRVVYEAERGPVPEGLYLDHLCRRRRCCNPAHLEPISAVDNQQRKSWASRARRRTCQAGHDLSLYAVVTPEGGRLCRRCNQGEKR